MKFIKIALLLCSLTCAGQYHFFCWQEHIHTPADFPEGTSRMDIYEVKFNKKGRAKDSTIVRTVLYDKATNTVSYKKPIFGIRSQDFIEYSDFKYQYDNQNRVVYSEESRSEKQKKGGWLWAYRKNTYEYNSFGKVVKRVIDEQKSWYMLKGKDTLWDYVARDKRVYEYEYNDTLLAVDYITDFKGLYNYQRGILKDSTLYSYPRYKNSVYTYDDNGNLTGEETYTSNNKLLHKELYELDSTGRVIKEFLDTGYYYEPYKEPEWDLRYGYEYKDGNKAVTFYWGYDSRDVQTFDSHGNLTSEVRYSNGRTETDDRYEYTYKDDKIIKQICFSDEDLVTTVEFFYNRRGFLTDERLTTNTTSYLRYYYK